MLCRSRSVYGYRRPLKASQEMVPGENNMLKSSAPLVLLATLMLAPMPLGAAGPVPAPVPAAVPAAATMSHEMPNAIFTLRTGITQGKMVYIGKGGVIDAK